MAFDFEPEAERELYAVAGERIRVLAPPDDGWVLCERVDTKAHESYKGLGDEVQGFVPETVSDYSSSSANQVSSFVSQVI